MVAGKHPAGSVNGSFAAGPTLVLAEAIAEGDAAGGVPSGAATVGPHEAMTRRGIARHRR